MEKKCASKVVMSSNSDSEHQRLSLKEKVKCASLLRATRQSQSKTKSKLRPQTFNFSDESNDDGEEEILHPTMKPNLLKDKNSQLSGDSHYKDRYLKGLHKPLDKENLESPVSFSRKDASADCDLEWEELLKTPRCPKSQVLSGTCKKLLSSNNVTAYFHSTPKETKDRTKQKNLFLQKKCAQSTKLHKSEDDNNLLSNRSQNNIENDRNFSLNNTVTSQDDYMEVQDSSAQTSIQYIQSCDLSENCGKDSLQEVPYLSSNDSEVSCECDQKQKNVSHSPLSAVQSEILETGHPNNCGDNTSKSPSPRTSGYCVSQTSQSQNKAQFFQSLYNDKEESPDASGSFVEVQDVSVQVNVTDQDSSKAFAADEEPGVRLQESQEQNSLHRDHSVEDGSNNSSGSNSLYVSAVEPETTFKEKETSSHCLTTDGLAEIGYGFGQSSPTLETPCTGDDDCGQTSANSEASEASVLVANTDSDCSETEAACGSDFGKIEASYSESSDSAEDADLPTEEAQIHDTANDNRSSSARHPDPDPDTAAVLKQQWKDQDKSIIDGDVSEMSEEAQVPAHHRIGDEAVNKGKASVSEISDMLKSTTISSSCQRTCDSSDDDEDAFEKFLQKMKTPVQTDEKAALEKSLSDFIAADDEDLSDENSSCSNSSDNEVFHVRVDNIIDSTSRRRPKHFSLHDEKTETSAKSNIGLDISSDDDDLLDDFVTDFELGEKTYKTRFETSDSHLRKSKSVSKSSDLPSKMPQTPHTNLRAQTSVDDADDDDFKTPFQTPRRPVKPLKTWERPFETPVVSLARKYETPSVLPDKRSCPMTVSRLHRPSRPSTIGLDDDAIFLKSLSEDYPDYKRHPGALRYIKHFKERKAELTKRLFSIYNKSVFKEQLPADLEIEWSSLYRKTAGTFCYRSSPAAEAKITLSVKVCDRAERVRDTLAHELCHAAVRLINGVKESHGPVWRSWAQKINRAFPFMPVIARCHDYIIATKYTYKCTKCNYRIGRHSKSLDIDSKVCGHCLGRFEVFFTRDLNNSEGGQTPATPRTPRTPNKFALFVKESYADVKSKDSSLKHADVMKILSQQFSEKTKISE